jgi:hypothetical protein
MHQEGQKDLVQFDHSCHDINFVQGNITHLKLYFMNIIYSLYSFMYGFHLLFTYLKFINISFPHVNYQHIVYPWAFFLHVQDEIFDAQCMVGKTYKQYIDGPRMQEGFQDAMLQARFKARQ